MSRIQFMNRSSTRCLRWPAIPVRGHISPLAAFAA
ncbi:hypothetical protein U6P04_11100 [Cutibacterium acnes]|nr:MULTISPECIES: hypothetical protein [Cutibacterium]MCM8868052.1 hypothetical protein [Cutibacterium acnes]MCM8875149.1 hypothetical protein [Cutibacterium acnes]MCP9325075.1 hypothetical protein [Cutibacterium acnes]MCP9336265.1 hypothetical protein [Cutibacterium acnes]MCP9344689.1 hypothetical protein [Cutibacterium acnes]